MFQKYVQKVYRMHLKFIILITTNQLQTVSNTCTRLILGLLEQQLWFVNKL